MAVSAPRRWSAAAALQGWLKADFTADPEDLYPIRSWQRWVDYDHLVWAIYLGFWFLQPYESHSPLREWVWLFIALAIFFPLYLLAHKAPRRFRWMGAVGMLTLGIVYVPVNQSACGIFIYSAIALCEVTVETNAFITLLLLQTAAIAAECLWLHLSLWVWSLGIGFSVLFGMNRLRAKQKARADISLRLAHKEIERLAKTAERERIARDMHDVLGHSLSLIVLKSELARKLWATQPERAVMEIADVETTAREALAEVRKTITGYQSDGFAAEMARAAQVLGSAGIRLRQPDRAPRLAPRHETTLSLVLREAVTNIVRHANASQCSIEWSTVEHGTRLVIADDGRGGIRQEGNGLRGMRERVREMGGSLSLASERGTRLAIDLPHVPASGSMTNE